MELAAGWGGAASLCTLSFTPLSVKQCTVVFILYKAAVLKPVVISILTHSLKKYFLGLERCPSNQKH